MDELASFATAGFGARFTGNRHYAEAKQEMERKKEVFIHSGASCSYFYAEVNSQQLPDLQDSVREKLEKIYGNPNDANAINDLLATYGTHFVRSMRFGASFKYIYKMSSKAYKSFEENEIDINDLASVIGMERTSKTEASSKYSSGVKEKFENEVSVQTVSVGATPPRDGDPMTWAANVKTSPAPIQVSHSPNEIVTLSFQTVFAPIYDLLSHPNFTSRFSYAKRHAAEQKMKEALLHYCETLR